MLSRALGLLAFTFLAFFSVRDDLHSQGVGDGSSASLKEGSILDTDAKTIKDRRTDLNPAYGYEDLVVPKGGTDIIDISDLPGQEVEWEPTKLGIIRNSRPRKELGQGKIELLAGNQLGTTEVLIYEKVKGVEGKAERGKLLKVFRVTVANQDLFDVSQQIDAVIGDVEGLQTRIVGDKVYLDGKILVPKDMRRVLTVYNTFKADKKPVVNLTELSPLTMKLLAEKMEEEIAGGKNKPRNIFVKARNGRFFLEGAVDKLIDREIAIKTCQAFVQEQYQLGGSSLVAEPSFDGLGECVNLVRIRAGQPLEPDPIINVRIDFVTLTREYLKTFDFRWAPGLDLNGSSTYDSDTGRFLTNFVATLTDLFPRLDTASRHGHARILKSATLLVRDGEDASAGGNTPPVSLIEETLEIPRFVPGTNGNPGTFQNQEVRTFVEILAKSVPGTDKINLDVSSQQAELQSAPAAGQGAPVLTNSVRTSIVVGNGESAALGGLIAERRSVEIERDPADNSAATPGVSNFRLFDLGRRHGVTDNKSQFIVFVTPTKVRSASEGSQSLKRKFRLRN